jgi:hypothetical protein
MVKGEVVQGAWIGDGERAEKHRVDEAESGGAGTDCQSEGEDGGERGGLVLQELTAAEAEVGAEGIEEGGELDVATGFSGAKGRAEGTAGFERVATMFDGFVEVGLELFVQVAVEGLRAKGVDET